MSSIPETFTYPKIHEVRIDPTIIYLSQFIGFVYIVTMSVHTLQCQCTRYSVSAHVTMSVYTLQCQCTRYSVSAHVTVSVYTLQCQCTRYNVSVHVPMSVYTLQCQCTRLQYSVSFLYETQIKIHLINTVLIILIINREFVT
jgi:hypothetical protein